MKTCKQCQQLFEITDQDKVFYKKMQVASPTFCPDCRQQRRLAFRNERKLYKRICDFSKKSIISIFSPDKPYKVYDQDIWWSDKWDALKYGRNYDFNRPFFEQFNELWQQVPQLAIINSRNENSQYTNFSEQEKDCYLLFASNRNRDCYYSEYIWDSKNCSDCLNVENCELAYFCVDCTKCYHCIYCQYCHDSHNLTHCFDCRASHDLFACAGLRNASFCILNKQYSQEGYERILKDSKEIKEILQEFETLKTKTPRLYADTIQCEDVLGSNLRFCRRCYYCFNCFDLEDAKYVENSPGKSHDVYDVSGCTNCELGIELVSIAHAYNLKFSIYSHTSLSDSSYCVLCKSCSNLFGCVSLKNKQYCILNKQYTQQEYQALLLRIIEQMTKIGEWGEFFPVQFSPFAYNETVAQDYHHLSKEDVLQRNWKWKDDDHRDYLPQSYQIPLNINDVSDTITGEILACKECGKNYRIIAQELAFYRNMKVPIPLQCPDCRYQSHIVLRNPRKLWQRQCQKCDTEIMTTYRPNRPEKIYCEKCYLGYINA